MPTAVVVPLVTAQQLWEHAHVDGPAELIEGKLSTMAPAGWPHGLISMGIGAPLHAFVSRRRLGAVVAAETGFLLSRNPDTVRAPDAAFISTARLAGTSRQEGYLEVAPDLVVEVVSPNDRAPEILSKVRGWLAAGSRVVWVVYPEQREVAVYTDDGAVRHVTENQVLDGGDVLPGFELPLAELFAVVAG